MKPVRTMTTLGACAALLLGAAAASQGQEQHGRDSVRTDRPGPGAGPGQPQAQRGREAFPGNRPGPGQPQAQRGREAFPGNRPGPGQPQAQRGREAFPGNRLGPGQPQVERGREPFRGERIGPGPGPGQVQAREGRDSFRNGGPAPFRRAPDRPIPHDWRPPGWAGRDRDMRFDSRFNHGYYYPRFGARIGGLPDGYRRYYWHGAPYFFAGGVWYAPGPGDEFIVARPPIGLFVPLLPPFYTTVYFGGTPYYYADDTYYLWEPDLDGYVVAQPPGPDSDAATAPPPGAEPEPTPAGPTEDFYIYPKNGQSEQQQATDRYQCYAWAKDQTGFDPTEAGGGVPPDQADAKRADYRRAMEACLDARGYSIK